MQVKLISYSQSCPNNTVFNATASVQDLIAFCARVSNPQNQMNMETSEKLIKYLVKHKHWSPLEMASVCLEITTTRDIARQILRHRSFSFQEFSQRYADPTKDLDFVLREARLQDPKNRQNSVSTNDLQLQAFWEQRQKRVIEECREAYQWAVSAGLAKEQARAVLPEGLIESRLYMNGTLRSWIHFVELRSANGTQLEHQLIAKECAKAISEIFPLAKELV